MNCSETPEFQKDFKRLYKKYPSLKKDLKIFLSFVSGVKYKNNKRFVVLYEDESLFVIKARFACMSLKKKSLRIIYVCWKTKDSKNSKVELIELYFKGDKEREDEGRIERYKNG